MPPQCPSYSQHLALPGYPPYWLVTCRTRHPGPGPMPGHVATSSTTTHPRGDGIYHQRPGHRHTSTPAPASHLPYRTTLRTNQHPAAPRPTPKRNTKNHKAPTRKHEEPETHQPPNPPNKHQPNPHPTGRAPPNTTVWEHKTSTGTTHRTKRENTVGGHGAQTQASQTPTGGAQAGHDSYGRVRGLVLVGSCVAVFGGWACL